MARDFLLENEIVANDRQAAASAAESQAPDHRALAAILRPNAGGVGGVLPHDVVAKRRRLFVSLLAAVDRAAVRSLKSARRALAGGAARANSPFHCALVDVCRDRRACETFFRTSGLCSEHF